MEEWQQEMQQLKAEYGTVPPPWIVFPNEHPYSLFWRMGSGEAHLMLWWAWWQQEQYDEAARIAYFRQWSPPACWLEWMAEAIWEYPDEADVEDEQDEDDNIARFAWIEQLGFGSRAEFERDLADPKWLNRDAP